MIFFANAKSDILRMQSDICPNGASDIFPCGKVEEEIEIEIATASPRNDGRERLLRRIAPRNDGRAYTRNDGRGRDCNDK